MRLEITREIVGMFVAETSRRCFDAGTILQKFAGVLIPLFQKPFLRTFAEFFSKTTLQRSQ